MPSTPEAGVICAHMELLDFFVKSMSMNVSMELAIMEVLVLTRLEVMNANAVQVTLGQGVRVTSMNACQVLALHVELKNAFSL